ncbi:hypothetical protein BHF71_10710 [Vulcanibacillus modesticaldus]|uniref:SHOCT domain-containing protein n=1 Tax=Vulcanibacillus modesticaldus TaxID=337097 RepID=A0A1D2YT28_9BACI|nr:SHOCT domain-containing protein [Vulcanibacillus modesticaldus]OEF98840.1 hypothetical protein BHF71_10710 [Vulcanibacillus modesticaldus]
MFLLLILILVGLYLYKTGDLQKMINNLQSDTNYQTNEVKRIIDMRLAKGEITEEEYNKLKEIL